MTAATREPVMVGGSRAGAQHEGRTDTELVHAALADDPDAFGELFQRWFDRSWNVARNIVRYDDLAAEVAQDAMLKAWQGLGNLQNPDAFGGWLLRITRNRALNRLEREQRSRATEGDIVSGVQDRQSQLGHDSLLGGQASPEVDELVDIRDRQELLWAAAQALGESDASLLDLHLRYGLGPAEIAVELGVEANAAHQKLFRMKGKLGDAIGSYLLWRNGRPLCDGLAAAVSGEKAFDQSVSKAVRKHQNTCEECAERRAGLVDPAKLFASVPLLAVPAQLKASAAAALVDAGVPLGEVSNLGDVGQNGGDDSEGGNDSEGDDGDAGRDSEPSDSGHGDAGDGGAVQRSDFDSTGGGSDASPFLGGTSTVPATPIFAGAPGTPGAPEPVPVPLVPKTAVESGGLAWTVAKRAWVRSLSGVLAMLAVFLLVIAFSEAISFSSFLPFGNGVDEESIGSEVVAGPETDETSQSATRNSSAGVGGANVLQPVDEDGRSEDASDEDGSAGDEVSGGETTTSATSSSSTDSTGSSTSSSSSTETTETTVTTSSSTETTETTATSSSSTSDTRPTTETTFDPDTTPSSATSSSTSSSSSTTETTATPDRPVIIRFTSRTRDRSCNSRTDRGFEAIWATENVTSTKLILPDGSSRGGPPSGRTSFCAPPGSEIILIAEGPGGETKASTTL